MIEIEKRRSIRKYKDQMVEKDKLQKKDTREIYLNEESPEFELKQIIRDTAIAIEHIVLQAENLGLGTCWTAWFKQAEVRPILNIPNDKFVVCVLTVGYADENPKQRPRKSLDKIVRYEKW